MYTILVPVDGSDTSLRAAQYAARRARDARCAVHLLHVEKDVMAWEVGAVSPSAVVEQLREADAEKALGDCASQFPKGWDVQRHTRVGDPSTCILQVADELRADEIVMGSRGMRPLNAAVLGSTAYAVLHQAKAPVVIVR